MSKGFQKFMPSRSRSKADAKCFERTEVPSIAAPLTPDEAIKRAMYERIASGQAHIEAENFANRAWK